MKLELLGVPEGLDNAPSVTSPGGVRTPIENGEVTPPASPFTPPAEAHALLKAQAQEDGWWALYDPTNPASVTLDESGNLTALADSLGNGPTLTVASDAGVSPLPMTQLGALNGFAPFMWADLSNPGHLFALSVSRFSARAISYPFYGVGPVTLPQINKAPACTVNGGSILASSQERGAQEAYNYAWGPDIFSDPAGLTVWGFDTRLGNIYAGNHLISTPDAPGSEASIGLPLGILSGSSADSVSPSGPASGPLLLSRVSPSEDVRRRMVDLLTRLSGAPVTLDPDGLTVESYACLSASGELQAAYRPWRPVQTASVIKALFAYRARKVVPDSMLDTLVAVVDPYFPTDNRFPSVYTGDTLSWRDLLTITNHVSHNRLSSTIAYHAGKLMNPSAPDPIGHFLAQAKTWATSQGWTEAVFQTPNGSANSVLSTLHVAQLFHLIRTEDTWLTQMMGTPSAAFTINHVARGEQAAWVESGTVQNLITENLGGYYFPELVMGKGGNISTPTSTQTLAALWRDPAQQDPSAIMYATGPGGNYTDRILGSRRAWDAVRNRYGAPPHWGASGQGALALTGRQASENFAVLAKDPSSGAWDNVVHLLPFNTATDPLPTVRKGDVISFSARVKKPFGGGALATRSLAISIKGGHFTDNKSEIAKTASIATAPASAWESLQVSGTVRRGGVLIPSLYMTGSTEGAAMWMQDAALTITTPSGAVRAYRMDLDNYSVSLDSQPLDLSNSGGGVGDFTASVVRPELESVFSKFGARYLYGKSVRLLTEQGNFTGTISEVDLTDRHRVTISGTTALGPLNAYNLQAPLFVGQLGGLLQTYISLLGESAPEFTVDPELAVREVVYPSWEGDLWPHLKDLCAAHEMQVYPAEDGTIHFGKISTGAAPTGDVSGISETGSPQNLARAVDVIRYRYREMKNELVYPPRGWDSSTEVITVSPGEVLHYDLQLEACLTSFVEPLQVSTVSEMETRQSCYTIVDETGRTVSAEKWNEAGGSVKFTLAPDGRSIHLLVVAPVRFMLDSINKQIESYSFGSRFGDAATQYSTLRILGSGVSIDSDSIRFSTGVEKELTGSDVGSTIDNMFITSMAQAGSAGMRAALTYSGARAEISYDKQTAPAVSSLVSYGPMDFRHRSSSITPEGVAVQADYYLRNDSHQQGFSGMTYDQVEAWYENLSYADAQNRGKKL